MAKKLRNDNTLAYISRKMKLEHVNRKDQHLVHGAHYSCQHIAAEIKTGNVTTLYAWPDPDKPVKHMWIAACTACIQEASWGKAAPSNN